MGFGKYVCSSSIKILELPEALGCWHLTASLVGLIGGIIVIARMIAVFVEIIKMIAGTFGHDVQKCDRRDIM